MSIIGAGRCRTTQGAVRCQPGPIDWLQTVLPPIDARRASYGEPSRPSLDDPLAARRLGGSFASSERQG
ncbi:hypothetical protein [Cumulibacter manganitolerans]|uniref:hypothetical protein n=1 Tax=Cumulibacter manganitolerans TaxID=1884992 RepID=UPI001296748E|nr:hypothetical protein [Cumulibacter manganitolerans]